MRCMCRLYTAAQTVTVLMVPLCPTFRLYRDLLGIVLLHLSATKLSLMCLCQLAVHVLGFVFGVMCD